MKALTIDAYWAWAIMEGHKRVENRSWETKHRGPLLIHAGLSDKRDEAALEVIRSQGITPPADIDRLRGKILCVVDVVDMWKDPPGMFATEHGRSQFGAWWVGPCGWELDNVRPLLEPIACTGKQSLWTPPADVLEAIDLQLT